MSTVRVMRRNLATGQETIHAGYDSINLSTAIQFLEYNAAEEAKESGCSFRSNNRKEGTKICHERILSKGDEDVVLFYLHFLEPQAESFQDECLELTELLRQKINKLPQRGDKEEDCQKITLLNALNDLEHCINGVQNEDFDDECEEEADEADDFRQSQEYKDYVTEMFGCEHNNAVLSDDNEPATYHCPDCGENFVRVEE